MDLPRKLWIEKEDQNEQTKKMMPTKNGLNLYKQQIGKIDNIICINNNNSVKANFLFLLFFFRLFFSFTKFYCFLLKKLMFSHSLADKSLLYPLNEHQQKRMNPIWI